VSFFCRVLVLVHIHLASRADMKENLDRMLEKLDLILELARVCNFTLKRIESRGESRHINNVPSDDVRVSRAVEDVYVSSIYY